MNMTDTRTQSSQSEQALQDKAKALCAEQLRDAELNCTHTKNQYTQARKELAIIQKLYERICSPE